MEASQREAAYRAWYRWEQPAAYRLPAPTPSPWQEEQHLAAIADIDDALGTSPTADEAHDLNALRRALIGAVLQETAAQTPGSLLDARAALATRLGYEHALALVTAVYVLDVTTVLALATQLLDSSHDLFVSARAELTVTGDGLVGGHDRSVAIEPATDAPPTSLFVTTDAGELRLGRDRDAYHQALAAVGQAVMRRCDGGHPEALVGAVGAALATALAGTPAWLDAALRMAEPERSQHARTEAFATLRASRIDAALTLALAAAGEPDAPERLATLLSRALGEPVTPTAAATMLETLTLDEAPVRLSASAIAAGMAAGNPEWWTGVAAQRPWCDPTSYDLAPGALLRHIAERILTVPPT
ncbi:MAG: hypothetical protein AAB426_03065 [Myxococcota bacterium]